MSNKSGTSEQIISVPKGGGALKGIGETFSPDLFTGTGNFTVPIALPPGRNGFQPQLNLVYSTGNGNGPFGLGWNLSIPGVSRKTSKGVPEYHDYAPQLKERDSFILSGAEDLVPVSDGPDGATCYRPRTEGLFATIEHHHSGNNDYWEVRSKDGLISFYGTPESAGHDPAVVSDPSDRTKIFEWKLTLTLDPFGNRIEYEYERDTGEQGPHHWDQLYLKQIRYIDYFRGGEINFLATVTFHYEDRSDSFSVYRSGFEIRTGKRCTLIEIHTHGDEERLVRTYHLDYLDQREGVEDHLPLNGVSLLNQIRVIGHDSNKTEELPPLEFSYTRFEPEGRDFFPIEGRELPALSLASPDLELVDLFGNGLPDIVQMNGTVRYWRNLGNSRFDLPWFMREAPAGFGLADTGVQLIDADGDGRADLLVNTERQAGYFPLQFGGLWDKRSFQPYATAPSFDIEDPSVQLVDLDGDGVTDAIRSGSRLECFFNHPERGWDGLRTLERQSIDVFPNLDFADPRVKWGDMSGDGLQDPVLIHDGNVVYWANLGHGNWGRQVIMRNSPRLPYGYDPRRLLLGDVDGDGLADLVYVDHGKVLLWINQSGNSWSEPIVIRGTPSVTDIDAVRLVDLLGNGIAGVLWSADANGRTQQMSFLDFTGGVKPYLLNEMDNHRGAVTRVAYAPSTQFYLSDQQRPETRWKTTLPFPVQVVARTESIDAISGSKLTSEYQYHHGYWDGSEREFRGFGRVDQRDTEVFEQYQSPGLHAHRAFAAVPTQTFSPPTETRTWFHQGAVGDESGGWHESDYSDEYWSGDPQRLSRPAAMTDFLANLPRRDRRDALRTLRGSMVRRELYALDGSDRQDRPFTVNETLTGVREVSPLAPGEEDRTRIFFPHGLAERTTQWERGDDPMTGFTFQEGYDTYGQLLGQISVAIPRQRNPEQPAVPGDPYLVTYGTTDYIHHDTADTYMVNRVARTISYEIINDGSQPLTDLLAAIRAGSAERSVIGQSLTYYDGEAFEGLPFGQVGRFGVATRSETLVLTQEIVQAVYRDDTGTSAIPPYLTPFSTIVWGDEYPEAFREGMQPLAGYRFYIDANHERGYFVSTAKCCDFQANSDGTGYGLPIATRDPFGRETSIVYDEYNLLPIRVIDPVGMVTQAEYDYRVLQPHQVIDPNGNRTAVRFNALGLLERSAVMGKTGEDVGDTLDEPSVRLVYDFNAFAERGQPTSVRIIKRMHHVTQNDVPAAERDATIETIEYSDGFGRLVQVRAQAEDIVFDVQLPLDQSIAPGNAVGEVRNPEAPPRVVVSGWQVYDNKGRIVEEYEPFFANGWDYLPPSSEQLGQKVVTFYDPLGQVVRTFNPNGSEERVVFGIPLALNTPESFRPTPWERYTYDANDNAERTHSTGDSAHWNTPTSVVIDALGRVVITVSRNGANPETDWLVTRSTYDIRGNLLTVTDAHGQVAFRCHYDLADNQLRIENYDAGIHRVVLDALGNEVERRDSKGALVLERYDQLVRPSHAWGRDSAKGKVTLRTRQIYGDSPESGHSEKQARAANLLGRLFQSYDEAGRVQVDVYDFKGNVLEKQRQVISDTNILSVFPKADDPKPNWQIAAFQINWQPPKGSTLDKHASALLDPTRYQTSASYDALNRVIAMQYPQDVEGKRKELRPRYNNAALLEGVTLDGATFVERIAYNARGQRTLIAYGNGVMTRYAYDPQTFRLTRMCSERYTNPEELFYHPVGAPVQDYGYTYDLVGNITRIHDRTPESGIPNSTMGINALDRNFSYDPLYRLRTATGRECALPDTTPPWNNQPRCADLTRTRGYIEKYRYDPLGNLLEMRHHTNGKSFVREFILAAGGNRLQTLISGETKYGYSYDANGNLLGEDSSRHFEWNYSDQLKVFRTQVGTAEPSVHAHYFYGVGGQRVKKLVRKQGGQVDITIYIDGVFEHHRLISAKTIIENSILHVMDDQQRIATVRVGNPFSDDSTPAVKYHIADHLGSSNLVIGQTGSLINREEYTPYGETSVGSFAKKRYRYTGKERDEESGLSYHGVRYYAPWLARWANCDPAGMVDGLNIYRYGRNNPMIFTDSSGTQSETSEDKLAVNQEAGANLSFGERLQRFVNHMRGLVGTEEFAKEYVIGQIDYFTAEEQQWLENALSANNLSPFEFVTGNSVSLQERLAAVKQPTDRSGRILAMGVYLSKSEITAAMKVASQQRKNVLAIQAARARTYRQFVQGQYRYGLSHTAILGAATSEIVQAVGVDPEKAEAAGALVASVSGLIGGGRGRRGGRGGGGSGSGSGSAGGAGGGPSNSGWTRVSRWMSKAEAQMWRGRSSIPQPLSNSVSRPRVDVTLYGDPKPGGTGTVRVDFYVPTHSLQSRRQAANGGTWFSIFNQNRHIPIYGVRIN